MNLHFKKLPAGLVLRDLQTIFRPTRGVENQCTRCRIFCILHQHRHSSIMAQHGSVEQELWNIFTFYTLHGNPMYPDLLKSSQFSKLCKQCLIMKSTEMPNGLPGAVINVVYIGEFLFCWIFIFCGQSMACKKRTKRQRWVRWSIWLESPSVSFVFPVHSCASLSRGSDSFSFRLSYHIVCFFLSSPCLLPVFYLPSISLALPLFSPFLSFSLPSRSQASWP